MVGVEDGHIFTKVYRHSISASFPGLPRSVYATCAMPELMSRANWFDATSESQSLPTMDTHDIV